MAQPFIRTSVNVSPEFHNLCKKYYIKFSDALRIGISISLAEKGIIEYNNQLNIVRLYNEAKRKAGAYAQRASDIENKRNVKTNTK